MWLSVAWPPLKTYSTRVPVTNGPLPSMVAGPPTPLSVTLVDNTLSERFAIFSE
jgi:hypothetical protein